MLFHGRNLRLGRFSEAGRIYVLTSVTHDRPCLFVDWQVGRFVAQEFRRADDSGVTGTLAWVVMPDHFHWLIELRAGSLGEVVRGVKSRSAKAINRSRKGGGPIWQKGYHDRALRREDDVAEIARYIVANPLRAGLVSKLGAYPLWDAKWI